MGKAPVGVASVARERGVPVVCLAGGLGGGADEVLAHGIDAVATVVPGAMTVEESMARGAELIEAGAARACRLVRVGMRMRDP
jgi:glycerate kinase